MGCLNQPLFTVGCSALLILATAVGCKAKLGMGHDPSSSLGWHRASSVGGPIAHVREACGETRCSLNHEIFSEIEYSADASDNIESIVLRSPAISPPNVTESRQTFMMALEAVSGGLGQGKTLLESGDPTYWPDRLPDERVVTLTMGASDRTIFAVGPAGPDREKIPRSGAAYNRAEAQKYWLRLFESPAF